MKQDAGKRTSYGLFVLMSHQFAGRSVDQVHPRAGKAGHGLIIRGGPVVVHERLVGEPSLHVQASPGAPIDKGTHHELLARARAKELIKIKLENRTRTLRRAMGVGRAALTSSLWNPRARGPPGRRP